MQAYHRKTEKLFVSEENKFYKIGYRMKNKSMLPILDASNIFFTTNYWFAKQLLSFNLVEFKQL
jgi:hypothetical protein